MVKAREILLFVISLFCFGQGCLRIPCIPDAVLLAEVSAGRLEYHKGLVAFTCVPALRLSFTVFLPISLSLSSCLSPGISPYLRVVSSHSSSPAPALPGGGRSRGVFRTVAEKTAQPFRLWPTVATLSRNARHVPDVFLQRG